jgi:hypothetical protein
MIEKEIKSCSVEGCDKRIHAKGLCRTHSLRLWRESDTRLSERISWQNMKRRCYYEKNNRFYCYGARGITVCDRWKDSFDNFYEDMGKKPSKKHQLDRTNNDGNYEPSNCKWVTIEENMRNRSTAKLCVEDVKYIRASSEHVKILCAKFGVGHQTIYNIKNKKIWKNVE